MSNGYKQINWSAVAIGIIVIALIAVGGFKACSSRSSAAPTADSTVIQPHPVPAVVDTGVKADTADSAR